jgi:hypothetical protein
MTDECKHHWFLHCDKIMPCVSPDWKKATIQQKSKEYMSKYVTPSDEAFVRVLFEKHAMDNHSPGAKKGGGQKWTWEQKQQFSMHYEAAMDDRANDEDRGWEAGYKKAYTELHKNDLALPSIRVSTAKSRRKEIVEEWYPTDL